jgi:transcriptional regulator with XRE-family HTH domain
LAYNAIDQRYPLAEAYMTFAKKLQELRERAELSQSGLAQASGIPVWTVRGYEQGRREPSWDVLFKLAAALGVTCDAFADCVDTPAGKPKARGPASRPKKIAKKGR